MGLWALPGGEGEPYTRTVTTATALIASLFIAAAPAAAQVNDDATEWKLESPPQGQGVTAPTTPEGTFSHPDRIIFGEQMRQRALDQICKGLDLSVNQSFDFKELGGVSAHPRRNLRSLPDDRLALVDELDVKVSLAKGFPIGELGDAAASLTLSASLEGGSIVSRPTVSRNACTELKQLLKAWTFKTALPISSKRLSQMAVGELWKLPMVIRIAHSEGLAQNLAGVAGQGLAETVSVSFGSGQDGAAVMTLYRLSEDQLRFRFRVDHVRIHNRGGSVMATYPAPHVLAAYASNLIFKELDRLAARELSRYLQAAASYLHTTTDGQQVLMEFVFDPRDPDEMELLASAVRGDIKTLVMMAQKMVRLKGTAERARQDFAELEKEHERTLGRVSNYPALNDYHAEAGGWGLRLPFLINWGRDSNEGSDRIVRLTEEGGQFKIFHADSAGHSGMIDIPIKGNLVKHDYRRSAQTFVYEDKQGVSSQPQAVYIYQEGFLRRSAEEVRGAVDEANSIMERVGTRGGAPNPRLRVPVDPFIPKPAPSDPFADEFDRRGQTRAAPTYRRGNLALTLVLTEKAVASILAASAELIAKCYQAVVDTADAALIQLALDTKGFDANGKLDYDWRTFRRAFADDDGSRERIGSLTRIVTALVQDVQFVRDQPTPADRAQALSKLLSGDNRSGLKYAEMLKVLVQLCDPLDVTADFQVNVDKKVKGEQDAHAHFSLRDKRADNPLLKQAADAKSRFAKPSDLVD